jgi:cyclin B
MINENARAVLIDWIMLLHVHYKLLPETLFITVNLIDRFMSHRHISNSQLQLVGLAAVLISTKYEEIMPP